MLKHRLFSLHMKEGASLKDHLDELNSILMELRDIDVKVEDEDAAMIMLVSLPPSYENLVSSLSVGRDYITLEEVRSTLHSRELRHRASGNGDEGAASGLTVAKSTKRQHKKKSKDFKKTHLILGISMEVTPMHLLDTQTQTMLETLMQEGQ